MAKSEIIADAVAGLDLDRQPLVAARKEDGRLTASVASNVVIDQTTRTLDKAPGSVAWIDTAIAANDRILKVIEYVYPSNGQRVRIARAPSGFYKWTGSAWTSMSSIAELPGGALTGGQATQIPTHAQIGRHLVICDGMGAYYWDGITTHLASTRVLEPPISSGFSADRPKLTLENGGAMAKREYDIWFSFHSDTGDSGTGATSPPLRAGSIRVQYNANLTIRLHTGYGYSTNAVALADGVAGGGEGFLAPPKNASDIYVYHSTTSKNEDTLEWETKYFRGATKKVAASGAGTIGTEITIDIAAVSTTNEIETFEGPPGGVSQVCEHIGRAFYSGSPGWPVRIWWSEAGKPFEIQGHSWIDVGQFDDPIVAIRSFPYGTPMLAIFKKYSVWTLSGFDESTFVMGLQPAAGGTGCVAPHAIHARHNTLFYWGPDGVYSWANGSDPVRIDRGIRTQFIEDTR